MSNERIVSRGRNVGKPFSNSPSAIASRKWRAKNPERNRLQCQKDQKNYYDRNTEKVKERNRMQNTKPHIRFSKFKTHLKLRFGMTLETFITIWRKQKGLCLGCDIPLLSSCFDYDRQKIEKEGRFRKNIDYSIACIDHDHNLELHNPDSIRGLLCYKCNNYGLDVLNPESDWYVLGEDGYKKKEILIKMRELLKCM